MLGLTWRRSALVALNNIIAYVADRDPGAARRLRLRILESVQPARSYPEMFREGRVPNTREIVAHPNYVVIYRIRPDRMLVLTVLHARQKYPSAA